MPDQQPEERPERPSWTGRRVENIARDQVRLEWNLSSGSAAGRSAHDSSDFRVAGGRLSETPSAALLIGSDERQNEGRSETTRLTGDCRRLRFDPDESYGQQGEAEFRAMLDASRFTVVRRLGAGGMGLVFEAYDQKRRERVALKTMRRADPAALIRLVHEFRCIKGTPHPNLLSFYELVALEDRCFFTMELVEGCDFVRFVRLPEGQPAASEGAGVTDDSVPDATWRQSTCSSETADRRIFDEIRLREALRQVARGVDALHRRGKLHRDIKPTNVLVTRHGRTVLIDFGLTVDLEPTGTYPTADRRAVGTLAYMSPEQAAGCPITAASDWYSVGVMLYEAMTGQLPFIGTLEEVAFAKGTHAVPDPGSVAGGLPDDLAALCVDLLDCNPSRRPKGRQIIDRLHSPELTSLEVPEASRWLPLVG